MVLHIQFDWTAVQVTFDGLVAKGIHPAGIFIDGKPHIGAALVVVNDVGGDIVDCLAGWALLLGEHAADNGYGVADRADDVEAENDGNAGFDVREDSTGHVWTGENKRLIASLGYCPYH